MTASVIIGIVALTGCVAISVSIAVVFSRALQGIVDAHSRRDELHAQHMNGLLDRFQAIRWEDLAALRSTSDAEEGGFFPPISDEVRDDTGVVEQHRPGRWGSLSRVELNDEEAAMLAEDFPEEMTQ